VGECGLINRCQIGRFNWVVRSAEEERGHTSSPEDIASGVVGLEGLRREVRLGLGGRGVGGRL